MKTAEKIKSGYIPVTELERGDTVVNLGVIAAIYPNRSAQTIKISFSPSRSIRMTPQVYNWTDKLMIA